MKENKMINFEKLTEEVHIKAIKMVFVSLVPMILGMGVLFLINTILNQSIIRNILLIFITIYTVLISILYAYYYAKERNEQIPLFILFSLLFSFFCIYMDQIGDSLNLALPILIMNIIGTEIIYQSTKIKRKIPLLPISVNEYLMQLIPIFTTLVVIMFFSFFKDVYIGSLQILVQFIMQFFSSIVGMIAIVVLTCYFWQKGIHGVSIIGMICRPFWTQMLLVNFYYVLNDVTPVYIGVEGFYQWFIWIGGSGTTLGLIILCRWFAKSHELKSIGKGAFKNSLFNINEQVIFGLPIALNNYFKIPFYAVPIGSTILTYLLMYFHYIPIPYIIAPWVCPSLIGGVWSVGGNMIVVMYIIILIILSIIIYFPFFKKYDNYLNNQKDNS